MARQEGMYSGVKKIFAKYWRNYGGIRALIASPYLHAAVVLTLLMAPLWQQRGWWDTPLSVMPSVLGFSLGGYAIWLAIGDDRFRAIISGASSGNSDSPFMKVNASFVHFIFLQFLAIMTALLCMAYAPEKGTDPHRLLRLVWGAGFFVFVYALLSALAATMQIFRVAGWYDDYQTKRRKAEQDKERTGRK